MVKGPPEMAVAPIEDEDKFDALDKAVEETGSDRILVV